jgi:hypothetical protein
MFGFELAEESSCRPYFPFLRILQALPDTFLYVGARCNVEQSLIGFGVLHNGRSLALHGKHYGALAFLELFHEIARPAPERRQRLNVTRDVKHGSAP